MKKYIAIPSVVVLCLVMATWNLKGTHAQNKGTPVATTGIPAPMMYDAGDPITLGYPCDASHTGIPFYNMSSSIARPIWICNGTIWIQALPAISGTTASIGGALLAVGSSTTGTATIPGAAVGQVCDANPSDGSFPNAGVKVECAVTAANTVTVKETAFVLATPPPVTFNIRVIQ